MKFYYDCKTYKTGLYKPHTIQVNNVNISIIYSEKKYYVNNMVLNGIAIDSNKNSYEIYTSDNGNLAFPVSPDTIKELYPWF